MTRATAVFDYVINFSFFLGIVILVVVWGIVSVDVVMRYLFNRPIMWGVEATEYGLVLITFLGAAWLLREKQHTSIDVVVSHLTPGAQRIMNIITCILGASICSVIAFFTALATIDQVQRGVLLTGAVDIPQAYLFVVIPLGSTPLALQFLRGALGYLVTGTQAQIDNKSRAGTT